MEDKKLNVINRIMPYKLGNTWVFDDPKVGLREEALIAGIDKIIDLATATFRNPEKGFTLLFSGSPFPGYQYKLIRVNSELGGTWYFSEDFGMQGWLCPALFRYFDKAPDHLYAQAVESSDG